HPPAVVREALRRREQPVACAQQRLDAIAKLADAATRGRHDEVVRGERPLEIGGHLHSVGHAYAGEVFAILASRRDLFGLRGVSGPEDHVLATVAREDRREGGAPGSRLAPGPPHDVPTPGPRPRRIPTRLRR